MVEKREEIKPLMQERRHPSILQRWKKVLLTGIIGLGISLPWGASAVEMKHVRGPPIEHASLFETDYKEGWQYANAAFDCFEKNKYSEGNAYKSLKYFESKYKQDKRPESLYMFAYSHYLRAIDVEKYQESIEHLRKTLSLTENGIKEYDLPIFIGLKSITLYNLGQIYADAYKEEKNEKYRLDAIRFLNEFIEFYKEKVESLILNEPETLKEYKSRIKDSQRILRNLNK